MLKYFNKSFFLIFLVFILFFLIIFIKFKVKPKEFFKLQTNNIDYKIKKNIYQHIQDYNFSSLDKKINEQDTYNSNPIYYAKKTNDYILSENYSIKEVSNYILKSEILQKIICSKQDKIKYEKLKYNLLQGLIYDYYNNFSGNLLNILLYDTFLFKIIKKVNELINENSIFNKDQIFKYFIILKRNYLSIEQSINNKLIFKIKVVLNIYRPFRNNGFQLKLTYIINNSNWLVLNIDIVGNFLDSDITKISGFNIKNISEGTSFNFNHSYFKLNQSKNKSFDKNKLLSNEQINLIFPKNSKLPIIINNIC